MVPSSEHNQLRLNYIIKTKKIILTDMFYILIVLNENRISGETHHTCSYLKKETDWDMS